MKETSRAVKDRDALSVSETAWPQIAGGYKNFLGNY